MQFLLLAGLGLQGFGQIGAGFAKKQAADYNASLLRQRAEATRMAAESETGAAHKRARRMGATQRAAYSKSGARTDVGTPLMVLADQAAEMELDIMEQRRTRMIQEQQFRSQAKMVERQGRQALTSSLIGAGGTLLSGTAKAKHLGLFDKTSTIPDYSNPAYMSPMV